MTEFEDEVSPELARLQTLQTFADALEKKRKAAVEAKEKSGIEAVWDEDEDQYNGIDAATRDQRKGLTPDAPLVTEKRAKNTRSTILLNITQPFVDLAASRAGDMLLPTEEMPFDILPTPEPDLVDALESNELIQAPNGMKKTAAEVAKMMMDAAKKSADLAQTRMYDWWTQWDWHTVGRQAIDQGARIGVAVLKGPFPDEFKKRAVAREGDQVRISILKETRPKSKLIDPRNFFPDPLCGEDIQSGQYVFERDFLTARALRDLKKVMDPETGEPIYLLDQIDELLEEGPSGKWSEGSEKNEKDMFTIWYFQGFVGKEELEAANCKCEDGAKMYPAQVTMVDGKVISATIAPLDAGEFTYDVLRWQRVPGVWWGKSVSRQVRAPQKMLTAAVRNMMDNAGMSAAPIIVIKSGVEAADNGDLSIRPRLVLKVTDDTIRTASDAVSSVSIDSRQAELMNIINMALQMAERTTGMSLQIQGLQGENQETAQGRLILQNNAGAMLRRIAKIFDDCLKPHIRRYYDWILQYGEKEEQGDFEIKVKGSSVFFERDQQQQFVAQMLQVSLNPAFGLDPKRVAEEAIKAQKLDSSRFKFTDDEMKQIQSQPPPPDPRIQVAQIKAQTDERIADKEIAAELRKVEVDTDRDTVHVQSQTIRDQNQHEYNLERLRIQERLAVLEYANKRQITLDQAKTDLAKTTMELAVQKELALGSGKVKQVAPTDMEPVGRAENGEAFQA